MGLVCLAFIEETPSTQSNFESLFESIASFIVFFTTFSYICLGLPNHFKHKCIADPACVAL